VDLAEVWAEVAVDTEAAALEVEWEVVAEEGMAWEGECINLCFSQFCANLS